LGLKVDQDFVLERPVSAKHAMTRPHAVATGIAPADRTSRRKCRGFGVRASTNGATLGMNEKPGTRD
jgi:hypothetical protein